MDDSDFLPLNSLFDAIGIIEKGISRLYHHLLLYRKIENLKKVCSQYDLTLKRGYKIASVLNDLDLVQIYDRPMKIHLNTPVIPIWQKIVNDRIEELRTEFQQKKQRCEETLKNFFENYNLEEEQLPPQEPVEFISYDWKNLDEILYPFSVPNNTHTRIAVGIRYENPLAAKILETSEESLTNDLESAVLNGIQKIREDLKELTIYIIFNDEILENLLQSKEYKVLSPLIDNIKFSIKEIEVHITEENFSNFILTQKELIQPSFDPSNQLIGSYISRNSNIYQIFEDKFSEIFKNGIPLNDYLANHQNLSDDSLTDKKKLTLCLL
ncbi:MAG: hypothetical protein ACOC44_08800 [Promethearchaeia archaeon]